MGFFATKKPTLPSPQDALPGRQDRIPVASKHFVLDGSLEPPFPDGMEQALFWTGLLLGAERKFWQAEGVYTTAVGYAAGSTPNPTYHEVCSGDTGPQRGGEGGLRSHRDRLRGDPQIFWESHDPTQGMRQGNDVGTQYRSGIYTNSDAQRRAALESREAYQEQLSASGYSQITTEIIDAPEFFYAEDYHQQYLAKNPGGYCGLGGTGVSCPIGVGVGVARELRHICSRPVWGESGSERF